MAKYIKVIDGFNPISYTIEELIEEYPGVDFCSEELQNTCEKKLADYNVYLLHESQKPIIPGHDKEGPPVYIGGKWVQNWIKEVLPPWLE